MNTFFVRMAIVLLASGETWGQVINWGIVDDDAGYRQVPLKAAIVRARGLRSSLPTRVSYENALPPVLNQGDGYQTCVAFACGYYLRSAMETIQRRATSVKPAFSPTYLYEKIKTQTDYNCTRRSSIEQALNVLTTKGTVLLSDAPYPNCGLATAILDGRAAQYRIGGYQRLFDPVDDNYRKIEQLKTSLAEGFPIVVGFYVQPSFQFVSTDQWQPAPGETRPANPKVGHALCVVGYDDTRYGGAFRVVNSWGTNWGQRGFCWIAYNDLADLTKYAFQAYPAFSTGSVTGATNVLAGSLSFELTTGEPMPVVQLSNGATVYQMVQPYKSGTAFRFLVEADQQAYLYAFGTDDRFLFTTLFPNNPLTSALFAPGSQLTLPSAHKAITLDNRPGTDYFLLLLSDHELDPGSLRKQLTDAVGDLPARLQTVLGSGLPNPGDVQGESNRARISAVGRVVPLIVQFDHQ